MFFLGGADQYSAGVFNYPYAATPVMNGIFKGAEAIYNFSGGVHQEPLQVVNAEVSWNSDAPGSRQPSTFQTALDAWNTLRSNQELPEEVFGTGGLFDEACIRIYGHKAGKVMARFFNFFEPLRGREIPAFYPRKVYPTAVFWRLFQADSAYWGFDQSSMGSRALTDSVEAAAEVRIRGRANLSIDTDYGELQRRLSAFWRQASEVNVKGRRIVAEALASPDVKGDAEPDLRHLDRCLEVGVRFGRLLASYHQFAAEHASGKAEPKGIEENLIQIQELWNHLDSSFSFDTVDPKGGDLSSWTLTLEELRSNLLALSQSVSRRGVEFR